MGIHDFAAYQLAATILRTKYGKENGIWVSWINKRYIKDQTLREIQKNIMTVHIGAKCWKHKEATI